MMRRRDLLTGIGAGTVVISGCLSSNDSDSEYEQCPLSIVRVSSLPASAHEEVTTAIEGGEYETRDGLALPKVINIDKSYLWYRNEDESKYFDPEIEEGLIESRLQLVETYPSQLCVVNLVTEMADNLVLDVRIEHVDLDHVLIEETVEVSSDERSRFGLDYRGTYRVTIEGEAVSDVMEQELLEENWIVIDEEGSVEISTGWDIGPSSCEWDDNGDLTVHLPE